LNYNAKQEIIMHIFKLFGWTVTIRRERKPHRMDTRAYGQSLAKVKATTTASLRKAYR
jgi:hypothetical protein